MNDASPDGAAVTLTDIAARIDDLTRELRRQGRASVAAQAAAESCLEKLAEQAGRAELEDEADEDDQPDDRDEAWARALIPVADALDRVVAQAAAMAERPSLPVPAPRRGLLAWLSPPAGGETSRDREIHVLAEGLRVLRAQLAAALQSRGVAVDRRTGVLVDPEVHRVVESREAAVGQTPDMVLEIVRPGYTLSDRVLREAEVVASRAG